MSNYQVAFDHALKELRECDPEIVIKNSLAQYCPKNRQYIVPFFKRPYTVSVETGEVYDQANLQRSSLGIGITIMNYLAFAQNVMPSGNWVSLKEVPGGMIFFPAFQKAVIQPLTMAFSQDLETFARCAAMLNGEKIKMGHIAAKFEALPKVPLAIVLWEGDEEVPGSANFLFDSTVEYFSPTETIIGYGYFIAHRLLNYAKPEGCAANRDLFWD